MKIISNIKHIQKDKHICFRMKTDDVVRSDDIKSSISILLSSFEEDHEQFLLEIYKRLQNGEKVFAVHKINEEFKYGEVSFFSNQLFFHCLSLSKVPKDSSLVWFEDVKQCLNYKSFCTFIKIRCNEKNKRLTNVLCNKFIKLCTGECGPSYKGSLLKKGDNKRIKSSYDLTNVLSVEKWIENESEKMRLIDYKLCSLKEESTSGMVTSIYFVLPITFDATWKRPFGRVISPLTFYNDINYENPSNMILDCGILINKLKFIK
ncbi:hypothetical protein Avbf_10349 [Armadillidium vulgare]|nr:hypothetical protein Avbf_10349 [Armadillidium vulgare]